MVYCLYLLINQLKTFFMTTSKDSVHDLFLKQYEHSCNLATIVGNCLGMLTYLKHREKDEYEKEKIEKFILEIEEKVRQA